MSECCHCGHDATALSARSSLGLVPSEREVHGHEFSYLPSRRHQSNEKAHALPPSAQHLRLLRSDQKAPAFQLFSFPFLFSSTLPLPYSTTIPSTTATFSPPLLFHPSLHPSIHPLLPS